MDGRRPGPHDAGLTTAVVLCLVVGAALSVALVWCWFGVYFAIWTPAEPPTTDEIARYEWTAALTLAAFASAILLSVIRRRWSLIVLSAGGLLLALAVAFVFQVPSGRFVPAPAPHVQDRDHPVCFGTTGDCPGG